MADPASPIQQVPADGVDPLVQVPTHVQKAADAAAAAHQATYNGNGVEQPMPNGAAQPPPEELPDLNPDGTPNWENRFK